MRLVCQAEIVLAVESIHNLGCVTHKHTRAQAEMVLAVESIHRLGYTHRDIKVGYTHRYTHTHGCIWATPIAT